MISKDVKVSVIVPVYNAEKTIKKAVCSILNQSYTNLEIILINDGSMDNSLNLCIEFAEKDNRVVVLNQNNTGVSSARNMGLEVAQGDFCCFIDSDDWIEKDYIERLVQGMQSVDCVIAGYTREVGGDENPSHLMNRIYELKNISDTQICPLFYYGFIHPCWNKLFKMSIINENHIKFDTSIHISEDSIFCINYLIKCEKIFTMDLVSYHYCINKELDSLSKKVYSNIFEIYEKVFLILKDLLERGKCSDNLQEKILVQTIYPQVYVSVLKILKDKELSAKERRTMLHKGLHMAYSHYVVLKAKKYVTSKYERFFLELIILKQYKLLEVILKWQTKRK